MPLFIQDYLDICDPVLTFDQFMGEIDLEKYLKEIPKHEMGRLRYNPVSMLKTILFGLNSNAFILCCECYKLQKEVQKYIIIRTFSIL